ncbi:hypothetical protein [Ohtaekwangia sp.]|uniref:hypothetical protein n=1 Tax=Ohtaekwangia sp. TaxID=2066019 RepID=UPI002F959BBC
MSMRTILLFFIAIVAGINSLQAQVSDSSQRTESRRPTINQSQEKPSTKEMLEIELNKNRDKGTRADTSAAKQGTNTGSAKNVKDKTQGASNIPAFDGGASSAGSPSELSGDNGKQRDGTNTVQRSSYNMAGSPPPRRSARAGNSEKAGKEPVSKTDVSEKSKDKTGKDKKVESKDKKKSDTDKDEKKKSKKKAKD